MIAPAAAAMNVAHFHVRIMQSLLANPDVHIAAIKYPKMRGGPFIDLTNAHIDDVRTLLDSTTSNCATCSYFTRDKTAQ
jgi:hypothetical protein